MDRSHAPPGGLLPAVFLFSVGPGSALRRDFSHGGTRISIQVSGTDIDFESLRQALGTLPLERLASLGANP